MDRSLLCRKWGCLSTRLLTIAGTPAIVFTLLLLSTFSFASNDQTIFGPKRYDLQKGKPIVYTDHFAGCIAGEQATLKVLNGDGKKTQVTSARIYINDIKVTSERDFRRKHPSFEKSVTINETNELKVVLKGGHYSYHKWLKGYLDSKDGPAHEFSKIQDLRKRITQSGNKLSSREIEHLISEFQDVGKSRDDRESKLIRLSRSLDEDFEDDDEDEFDHDDNNSELYSGWLYEQRAEFEKNRKEIISVQDKFWSLKRVHTIR